MKSVHIFDIDKYHSALSPNHNNVQVYSRQRGAGLGNIVARYSIPLVKKYVLPHVKEAAMGVYKDIQQGHNVKQSLKNNAISLMQNVGHDVLENFKQKGTGLARRKRSLPSSSVQRTHKKRIKKDLVSKRTKTNIKKKTQKKKSKILSKRDIFA